jgi:hypothetical protein
MTVYKFHGVVGDYVVPPEFHPIMAKPEEATREEVTKFYGWLRKLELRVIERQKKKGKKRIAMGVAQLEATRALHLSCAHARAAHDGSSPSTPSGDSIATGVKL